jgi:hypothetical protein
VERSEFEALRDLPGKRIDSAIRFKSPRNLSPLLVAESVPILTSSGEQLLLNINYNPIVGSKTFNVVRPGVGPICRLDVDGPPHRPAGRCHKHSLQSPRCPDRNLPDGVVDRPDCSGKSIRDLFAVFCGLGQIEFTGTLHSPDSAEGLPEVASES